MYLVSAYCFATTHTKTVPSKNIHASSEVFIPDPYGRRHFGTPRTDYPVTRLPIQMDGILMIHNYNKYIETCDVYFNNNDDRGGSGDGDDDDNNIIKHVSHTTGVSYTLVCIVHRCHG